MAKTFEIVILSRNAKGEVLLNKYGDPLAKSFASDNAYKIWEFWQRNGKRSERRWRGQKTKEKKPEKILEEINAVFAEEVQKKRRTTFDDGVPQ